MPYFVAPLHSQGSPLVARREETVIKYDIGVEVAGEDHGSQHQVGAHETDAAVAGAQAVGKLLREDDERGAGAVARDAPCAPAAAKTASATVQVRPSNAISCQPWSAPPGADIL